MAHKHCTNDKKLNMTGFRILIWIFSTMYPVHPGGRWVSAQSTKQPPVYQPDKELSVEIGDSAALRCCISENVVGIINWFKQPNGEKPQLIVTAYKSGTETYYNGFQKTRFRIERSSNCFNLIISTIVQSDEATYYCAVTNPSLIFGAGTCLKIKGEHVTIASETSKPALCDNSLAREPTLHGNNANINTHKTTERERIRSLHGTVLGLGTALGLCALLIICLVYFLLRRKESDEINASREDSPGTRQESEADAMNYAALKFSKKRTKVEKRKTGPSDECVYSDVNTTVRYKINNNS